MNQCVGCSCATSPPALSCILPSLQDALHTLQALALVASEAAQPVQRKRQGLAAGKKRRKAPSTEAEGRAEHQTLEEEEVDLHDITLPDFEVHVSRACLSLNMSLNMSLNVSLNMCRALA